MTYCVAITLDAGLVLTSDSRTNAGIDQVSTYSKMTRFETHADRSLVLTCLPSWEWKPAPQPPRWLSINCVL